jgi:diguanylate cyclase (GGDEF)-like protein/PAS domain S-box-containing protein
VLPNPLRVARRLPLSRTSLALFCGCAALVAGLWIAAVERVAFEREQAIAQAIQDNDNLALAFEEHTRSTLRAADQAVSFLKYEYESEGKALLVDELIASGSIDASFLTTAFVLDEDGNVVRGARAGNLADREYFRFHRDNPLGGLRIDAPVLGRISGKVAVVLSRRINKPDGSFGGVATIGVDPGYFIRFYVSVERPDGMIQLVHREGVAIARRLGEVASQAVDMRDALLMELAGREPRGSFLTPGRFGNVQRYASYRTMPDFPLIVSVGSAVSTILAQPNERARTYYLAAAVASALLLALATGLGIALARRRQAMLAQAESQAQFRQLAEHIPQVFWIRDLSTGKVVYVSPAHSKVCGLEAASAQQAWEDFQRRVHPEDLPGVIAASTGEREFELEHRIVRPDGVVRWVLSRGFPVPDESGTPYRFVGTVEDITERRQAQERLDHQARHDLLTGLPNRVLFQERLAQAVIHAVRRSAACGMLVIGADHFKMVNDTLGHAAGDAVLVEMGRRLLGALRPDDTVARMGDDEFAIVLSDLARAQDAGIVGQKVLDAMRAPFSYGEHVFYVTASVGATVFPSDGGDVEALMKNAGAALMQAKKAGRNTLQFYTAEMNERAAEKLQLTTDLRLARERGEFLLQFQPRASLKSGEVCGFEALLRWKHPKRGLVPPAEFIPLLEESGLIVPVGDWIVHAVCSQIRAWRLAGARVLPVAVNISAAQFRSHALADTIEKALSANGIPAQMLEIELTESAVMENPEQTVEILGSLREKGVRIAIDDFGTGYSSLAQLKRLAVDYLKLDRAFVTGLPYDAEDASITRAVIALAHTLGLKVVAEAVETEAQRRFLADNGCDEMQGWLLSKALPATECMRLLAVAAAKAA